jgi:hypothetical protein
MNECDKKRFMHAIVVCGELYNREVSKGLLRMYFQIMSEFSIDDVERVIAAHMRNSKFFPRPADLIEQLEPSKEDRGHRAASLVQQAIQSGGRYCSPVFDDPAIHHALREVGGWQHVCTMDADQWQNFGQRRFIAAYETHALRSRDIPPPTLSGTFNEVRFFGDPKKQATRLLADREQSGIMMALTGSPIARDIASED